MEKYSDKTILTGIRNRKDDILEYLYRSYFPQICRVIIKHGGNEHDARDLFQEALIIIFKRLNENNLVIKSSFHNYFLVLCKFIWFRQSEIKNSHRKTTDPVDDFLAENSHPETVEEVDGEKTRLEHLENQYEKIYQRHYRKLSGDCKRVLKMFFRKKSFREISSRMAYSNEVYARRKKYLCMQQLMKMVNQDPEYQELKKRLRDQE